MNREERRQDIKVWGKIRIMSKNLILKCWRKEEEEVLKYFVESATKIQKYAARAHGISHERAKAYQSILRSTVLKTLMASSKIKTLPDPERDEHKRLFKILKGRTWYEKALIWIAKKIANAYK